jgi:hypothetical protein
MPKSVRVVNFVDGLKTWAKADAESKHRRRVDEKLVAFIAVREDVQEALNAGFSLKTIWRYMAEKEMVSMSYETFRKHAHNHTTWRITMESPSAPPTARNDGSPVIKNPTAPPAEPIKTSSQKREFAYNPQPNIKELL